MNNCLDTFNNFYKENKNSLDKVINDYNNNLLIGKSGYLKDNLEIFSNLNSDGKLIRGILIALGYKLMGKNNINYSYNLSLAYEIFQTSVLIHDDIIDEDNLRRGKETVHFINYKKNKEYNENDAKKTGDSVGICLGSYGYFEANKVIINSYKNDENFSKILNYYNDIVLKTIEGELIDVELSFDGKYKIKDTNIEDNIMLVYKLKTAFYTIVGPLTLGLILGGIEEDKLEDIRKFGEKVGIAFQIQDDILGIYNDMGKVQASDIREYKQTLLFSHTLKDEKYKDELLKYYGKENVDEFEINIVREIFKNSGAYDYAYNMMNKLYNESLEILNDIQWIKEEDKQILNGFVEFLKNRIK